MYKETHFHFSPLFPVADYLDLDLTKFTSDKMNIIHNKVYLSTISMQNSFFPISYSQPCVLYLSCKGIYLGLANLTCSIALLPTADKYTSSFLSSLRAGGLMGMSKKWDRQCKEGIHLISLWFELITREIIF